MTATITCNETDFEITLDWKIAYDMLTSLETTAHRTGSGYTYTIIRNS